MKREPAIEISSLTKRFGNIQALSEISLTINQGELFGFIGPDGAGKTTLFRTLATLLLPDTGTATIHGMDVMKDYKQLRQCTGYMPGSFSLYYDLTVEENLSFFASIFGTTIKENYQLIKKIYSHIEPFKNRKAGALSGGMKQKLALSCALIHKPRLLILDEPTTGVDALSRKEFWTLLQDLKDEGITIIVSTPYMDEAEMCDRIALIHRGHIFSIDTPVEMVQKFKKSLYVLHSNDNYHLSELLKRYPDTFTSYIFGQEVHYTDMSLEPDMEKLTSFIKANNIQVTLEKKKPTIEDCFIDAIKELTNE